MSLCSAVHMACFILRNSFEIDKEDKLYQRIYFKNYFSGHILADMLNQVSISFSVRNYVCMTKWQKENS